MNVAIPTKDCLEHVKLENSNRMGGKLLYVARHKKIQHEVYVTSKYYILLQKGVLLLKAAPKEILKVLEPIQKHAASAIAG